MRLKGYLVYAVFLCKGYKAAPIGNEALVPLILEYFGIIIGPCAGYPVGIFAFAAIAGAAGKSVYLVYASFSAISTARWVS